MRYHKADRGFVSGIGVSQLRKRGTKRKTIQATNFIVLHGNCTERLRRKATSPHFVRGLVFIVSAKCGQSRNTAPIWND